MIAFAFLYFGIILLVFKQQFAHVYYRRNFESGGRQVFRRFFRYSLDIAVLSQVVAVAFFWTLSRFGLGGACIPLVRPLEVRLGLCLAHLLAWLGRSRSPSFASSSGLAGSTS